MSIDATTTAVGAAQRTFYGWYVAIACGIGMGCGMASVLTSTFQVFLEPLQTDFGWTRPQLFLGLTITLLVVSSGPAKLGTEISCLSTPIRGAVPAALVASPDAAAAARSLIATYTS